MANKDSDILNAFENVGKDDTAVDASRKMRIGIIGCGGIARAHTRAYLTMPDVEIVAGCDLVPGRARAFMDTYGLTEAKCDYPSHKEMLADKSLALDAVSVCTYNCQHAVCAIDALDAGVHVLLEKPLCVTMEEAKAILAAERRSEKVLSIGFQPRFDENMQMIKKIVQSGELGRIYYIQTGGGRRRGIPIGNDASFIREDTAGLGALGDIGCYSLDLVLNAIGYPKPLTVSGFKSDFFGKDPNYVKYQDLKFPQLSELFGVDDFAGAFIRLEGGIFLDFRISWAMNLDSPGDTIIMGTKGSLRVAATDCWNGTFTKPLKIYHEVAGNQVCTEIPLIQKKPGDPDLWQKKIRTFLDAAKNGTPAPVPIDQIIYNQAIISGIADSNAVGHEVTLDLPEL